MGYVKDPIARAERAKTKVQAARLHQNLEVELGLADHGAEWEGQAERALSILGEKADTNDWGDLSEPDAATAYTPVGRGQRIAHPYAPRLSRRASHALDQADSDTPKRLRRGEHPAGQPDTPSEAKRRARRSIGARMRSGAAPFAATASSVAGAAPTIPGLGSAKQTATWTLGGALGLVFLYLIVTDAENPGRGWPSAVQTAVGSITTAIMAIVRPVDPLRPHSPTPARAASGPVHVARTPTSGPTPLHARPLRVPRTPTSGPTPLPSQ
jgi:hypothetical protein